MQELIKGLFVKLFLLFTAYSALICFFGAFFFGAETVIILGILSAQGTVHSWVVALFCAAGIFTADTMWFFIGKIRAFRVFKKIRVIRKSYIKASEIIERNSENQMFLTLTLLKFVYGIAIPIIMYLGRRNKISYKRFALYNGSIILVWSILLTYLGWLAGKGYLFASRITENFYIEMAVLAGLFILVNVIINFIKQWLLKKENISKP
jgi:membrane protein DedA with SNARE-associated domain